VAAGKRQLEDQCGRHQYLVNTTFFVNQLNVYREAIFSGQFLLHLISGKARTVVGDVFGHSSIGFSLGQEIPLL